MVKSCGKVFDALFCLVNLHGNRISDGFSGLLKFVLNNHLFLGWETLFLMHEKQAFCENCAKTVFKREPESSIFKV
jgi:hypothetical protein